MNVCISDDSFRLTPRSGLTGSKHVNPRGIGYHPALQKGWIQIELQSTREHAQATTFSPALVTVLLTCPSPPIPEHSECPYLCLPFCIECKSSQIGAGQQASKFPVPLSLLFAAGAWVLSTSLTQKLDMEDCLGKENSIMVECLEEVIGNMVTMKLLANGVLRDVHI